ncbi:MAG: DUF58 domain-containing protein [Candidatus Gracilibacteria bacterium]|nr:DUF58 domain-containing protein [Candidatus Gracilibacteria bacterium]
MEINKKIKTLELKLSKVLNGGLFGAYKSKFHGSGMEFAEHREYVFGDSLRSIDWKTYNKTDTLYIKKYEEERDLNVLFILDNSKSMLFGSQEYTKKEILEEVFYSLAMSAYLNNDNIGAIIFDEQNIDYIEHKKSKENIYRIFQKLEENNAKSGKNLTHPPTGTSLKKGRKLLQGNENNINFSLFQRERPEGSTLGVYPDRGVGLNNSKIENILNHIFKRNIKNNLIFILTDDSEIKNEKILKLLGRENEIIYINILDDFENKLSDLGGLFSFNSGKEFINIDLSNSKKIDEYKSKITHKFKYLNELFRKNKVGYINLNTNSDIFRELLLYFYKVRQ